MISFFASCVVECQKTGPKPNDFMDPWRQCQDRSSIFFQIHDSNDLGYMNVWQFFLRVEMFETAVATEAVATAHADCGVQLWVEGICHESWTTVSRSHEVLPSSARKLFISHHPKILVFEPWAYRHTLVGSMALHHLKPDRKGCNKVKRFRAKRGTVPGATHRFRMVPERLHPSLAAPPLINYKITSMMLVSTIL